MYMSVSERELEDLQRKLEGAARQRKEMQRDLDEKEREAERKKRDYEIILREVTSLKAKVAEEDRIMTANERKLEDLRRQLQKVISDSKSSKGGSTQSRSTSGGSIW
jgi:chromosome segregation ATPase